MKRTIFPTLLVITALLFNFSGCSGLITTNPIVPIAGISLNKTTLLLVEGGSETLVATISPTDATDQHVSWSSSNTAVGTVTPAGFVTALAAGTAVITVTTLDGKHTATCNLTVAAPTVAVGGISLDESKLYLTEGDNKTLVATVLPENASNKKVSWSSSNARVASVSATGDVTALSEGETVITVSTEDGGKTATCHVTVVPATVAVAEVRLDKEKLYLIEGEKDKLVATVFPENATNKNVKWSIDNGKVASVSATGEVLALLEGQAVITVSTEDGGKTAICHVTVVPATVAVTGVSLNKGKLVLKEGEKETLVATVSPSDATNKNVKWSSENPKVASVSATGEVVALTVGVTNVTVTTEDGGKEDFCTVTVDPATIAVTGIRLDKTTVNLGYGLSNMNLLPYVQLTATVIPSNATNKNVSWSSSNTAVATVSNTGFVNATGPGDATITVRTEDGNRTATCTVHSTYRPVTGVRLNTQNLNLLAGKTAQLVFFIVPYDAGNHGVSWKSSNTAVATVSEHGLVTAISTGGAIITVSTEDGSKTATCSIIVPYIYAIPRVTGIALGLKSTEMKAGATIDLGFMLTPYNAAIKNVAWCSSDESVVTVDADGRVRALAGATGKTATVMVTSVDGGYITTCEVRVQ